MRVISPWEREHLLLSVRRTGIREVTPFDRLSKTRKTELLVLCARIGFTPPLAV